MALFGKKKDDTPTAPAPETYKVIYRGGLPDLPKPKVGEIRMSLLDDAFQLDPTSATKKFWLPLTIPYERVSDLRIVARKVSTFEGIAGGLDSRQLNQDNNIHIAYTDESGQDMLLRLEMLSGVTVMGQARKCAEFDDRLRNLGIRARFHTVDPHAAVAAEDVPAQIGKLAELHQQGVLSEDEFQAKKKELLDRM